MPRLRDTHTGVIVNVSEEQAKELQGFEPADEKKKSESKTSTSTKK